GRPWLSTVATLHQTIVCTRPMNSASISEKCVIFKATAFRWSWTRCDCVQETRIKKPRQDKRPARLRMSDTNTLSHVNDAAHSQRICRIAHRHGEGNSPASGVFLANR